jgi:hypothetical protein
MDDGCGISKALGVRFACFSGGDATFAVLSLTVRFFTSSKVFADARQPSVPQVREWVCFDPIPTIEHRRFLSLTKDARVLINTQSTWSCPACRQYRPTGKIRSLRARCHHETSANHPELFDPPRRGPPDVQEHAKLTPPTHDFT